jgi:hypothetical protein
MYVRRAAELNALSGWRATLSTCMELGDVLGPLFAGLADRVSAFLSWLLVSLIGRGLGLIYRGVKQSMSGKSSNKQHQQRASKRSTANSEEEEAFFGFSGA